MLSLQKLESLDALAGKTVMHHESGNYDRLKRLYPDIRFVSSPNDEALFKAVINQKVDAAINSYGSLQYFRSAASMNNMTTYLKILPTDLFPSSGHNYAITGKANPMLINIIDKVLSKKDVETLQLRWGLKDKEETAPLISRPQGGIKLSAEEAAWIRDKKEITVSLVPDYEPYAFLKNGKPDGFSIELLKHLLADVGLKAKFIVQPIAKSFKDIREHKVDLISSLYKTAEREKEYHFSDGYQKVSQSYIVRQNSPDIQNISELFGKDVGVTKSWSEENFLNRYPQINKTYLKGVIEKLDALAAGKIDAFMNDATVVDYYIKKAGYTQIKVSNPVEGFFKTDVQSMHFATLKETPHLIVILNKAYNNLSTLYLKELRAKWFGVVSEEEFLDFTEEEKAFLQAHPVIDVWHSSVFEPLLIDKGGKFDGMVPNVFALMQKKIPSKFEMHNGEWLEILKSVSENKTDVVGVMNGASADKLGLLSVENPFQFLPTVFAKEKRNFTLQSADDLKNLKIAYSKDTLYIANYLKKNFEAKNLIPVKEGSLAFEKVITNQADVAILMNFNTYILDKNGMGFIKPVFAITDINFKTVIGVRPDAKALQSILQKAMNDIDRNELLKIVEEWSYVPDSVELEQKPYVHRSNEMIMIALGLAIIMLLILGYLIYSQIQGLKHGTQFKKISVRAHYFIVLITVSLFILLAYLLSSTLVKEQTNATIINISGKQRMLSQRTILFAKEYFDTRSLEDFKTYRSLVALMEKEHNILVEHALDNDSFTLYFENPDIDALVQEYLNLHKAFFQEHSKETLQRLFTMSKELLPVLDRAVKYYENHAKARVDENLVYMWIILGILILIGLFEVIFVFRPTLAKLEKTARGLEEEKQKAERASVAKSDFLSNMSHEIRTPLNGIIGLTDIVLETKLDEDQKSLLLKAKTSSKALLHIINDILDYSKIEAGKLDIVAQPFHLDNVLCSLSDLFSYQIQSKGLEFYYYVNPKIPLKLEGDSLRLSQILTNLVGNAQKFTEQGSVGIHVDIQKQNHEYIILEFNVVDSGIGISPEHQEKLFESFSQADATTTKKYGGSGLGLAICKQLVELMGGEIWLESKEGVGSTFSFTMPFKYQDASNIKEKKLPYFRESRFLIAEDNEVEREYLSSILHSWGVTCVSARDGVEALEILRTQKVDYLLLDWKMPQMDGLALLKEVKEEKIEIAHVLMISAYAKNEFLVRAQTQNIETGKFLHKPYTASTLYEILSEDFQKSVDAVTTGSVFLEESKKALLVEDNEVNQIVATKKLENIGFEVDIANNGLRALEKTKTNTYDILFMDLQMPVMDGFEASRKIREFNQQVPIIALSAAVMERDKELTRESGMNDHLAKPIDRSELHRVIGTYFKTKVNTDNESQSAEALVQIEGINLQALQKEIGTDNRTIYAMLNTFKNTYKDSDVMALSSESERLRAFVHTLKGASGNLRIDALHELVLAFEKQGAPEEEISELDLMLHQVCEEIQNKITPLLSNSTHTIELSRDEMLKLFSELLADIEHSKMIKRERHEGFLDALTAYIEPSAIERIKGMFETFSYGELSDELRALQKRIERE